MSRASKKGHRSGSSGRFDKDNSSNFALTSNRTNSVSAPFKGKLYTLWPEFNENDINAEKWEASIKADKRGKSPSTPAGYQQCFDDPEGKVEMPSNMQVNSWSRIPQELNPPKAFVVVENEEDFDIINYSKHLCCYPLLRMIMSQITLLWNNETQKRSSNNNRSSSSPELGIEARWKPWEHIYSLCKANKGHIPLYNPNGKYICRLFYMGCWRKITIDDTVPYNADGQLLLPTSGNKNELWPMLLTKALLKVASVNYRQGNSNEIKLSEFSVIHCLTGWIPEITPLYPIPETWECLKNFLPKWSYPVAQVKHEEGIESEEAAIVTQPQQGLAVKERSASKVNPSQLKMKNKKEGDSSTSNIRKDTRREKVKSFEQSKEMQDTKSETFEYTQPETMIFATFDQNCPKPPPLSCIKDMSDGSEVLRSQGLASSMYHPILIKQTRSLPLMPPVVVPPIPRWKLIRPRPNKTEGEKPPSKPDMWLEVCSPFITAPNTHHSVSQLREVDEDEPIKAVLSESPVCTLTADMTPAVSPVKQPSSMRPSAGGDNLKKGSLKPSSVVSLKKKGQESNLLLQSVTDGKKSEKSEVNFSQAAPPVHRISNEYKMQEDANFIKNIWIDFDDFCKTFKHIVIFHKPHTYKYNATSFEFKPSVTNNTAILSQTPVPGSGNSSGKKSNIQSSNTNIHPKHAEKNTVTSINNYNPEASDKQSEESHSTTYLMVDSTEASEVVVCLSALTYWPGTDIKYFSSLKQDQTSPGESNSDVLEKKDSRFTSNGKNYKSSVVVEPFSWLDYKAYQTCMHINTCGTKALCLQLPAGRNLLKLNISWNFGHYLHLCSTTPFTYGDENLVMNPLKEESERFKLVAREVANCIDQLVSSVGKIENWKKCMINLTKAYIRTTEDEETLQLHKTAFQKAFYALIERLLIDTSTKDVKHICRVLTGNFTPMKGVGDNRITQSVSIELSDTQLESNVVIQKFLRGYIVRKTMKDFFSVQFRESGIMTQLKSALKTNQLSHGIFIIRKILKLEPSLIDKYDFKDDELKKCCYTEHQENFPEQPSHHWFLVFRGVFSCEENTWLVPALQGITPTNYLLHVVDNDTGKEVRRIFNRNIPHLYTKNQNGYTMVCEMKTGEMPLVGGRWKLKLIGQQPPQLQPITHIESNFVIKEFKGYYIPNEKFTIFKYTAHCKVSQVVSIQIQTSNKQAQFKLEIFNKGQIVASRVSKGQMFLPYCFFVGKTKSPAKVEQEKETKDTEKGKIKGNRNKKEVKKEETPKDDKRKDSKHETEEEDIENRMYYIKVTLLNYSWRLNADELQFVEKLKEQELEEFRLVPKQELGSPTYEGNVSKHTLHTPRGVSNRRSKTANKKKGEVYDNYTNSKTSITENVMIDPSKPSWQMRVVVDQERGEDIVVERDTTRQKQVKAMKMAWEALDEGRAHRAKEIRQRYLDSVKAKEKEKENSQKEPAPESSLGIKNPFEVEPEKKEPIYLTPDELNQAELERYEIRKLQDEKNRKELKRFLAEDQKKRNVMKEKLMEEIQQLQLETDMYRTHLLQSRNEYRQQMIDDARYELEKKEAQLHDEDKLDGRRKSKGKKKK